MTDGVRFLSQPARAVWIEIRFWKNVSFPSWSQPARAVWIEIDQRRKIYATVKSQPARAVWIEIYKNAWMSSCRNSHSLRGLCGLKYDIVAGPSSPLQVTACEGCVD